MEEESIGDMVWMAGVVGDARMRGTEPRLLRVDTRTGTVVSSFSELCGVAAPSSIVPLDVAPMLMEIVDGMSVKYGKRVGPGFLRWAKIALSQISNLKPRSP